VARNVGVDAGSYRPSLDANVRVPRHVVYRSFAAETVVMNLETGEYHGLSPAAGRALELLDRTGSARLAAARLAGEAGMPIEQAERECAAWCAGLADLGLLQVSEVPL
jgi:Coenzyme PQQ synthesis protein D (PqqD)